MMPPFAGTPSRSIASASQTGDIAAMRRQRFDFSALVSVAVALTIAAGGVHWIAPKLDGHSFIDVVRIVGIFLMTAALAVSAIMPFVFHRRQRRWFKAGRCRRCGYDLHAHQTGQRCPECGTEILSRPEDIRLR